MAVTAVSIVENLDVVEDIGVGQIPGFVHPFTQVLGNPADVGVRLSGQANCLTLELLAELSSLLSNSHAAAVSRISAHANTMIPVRACASIQFLRDFNVSKVTITNRQKSPPSSAPNEGNTTTGHTTARPRL